MGLFKNRTVIGILCIILSLAVCFGVAPLFYRSASQKAEVVRVIREIREGEAITEDMVAVVEVGGYNLPNGVMRNAGSVLGKFATTDMYTGDYILAGKLSDTPATENAYLYNLDGTRQAISVTIKTFASGLSGKLQSGDIVCVIAADYRRQGLTVVPPELQFVEVISVTASSGYDVNTGAQAGEEERELPSTVTLLVTVRQGMALAELEADGKLHLSLVYRGTQEYAALFIAAQDEIIAAMILTEEEAKSEDEGEDDLEGAEQDGIAAGVGSGSDDNDYSAGDDDSPKLPVEGWEE